MRKVVPGIVTASMIVILSCGGNEQKTGEDNVMGVQAVLWSQFSAEAEALYLQAFNFASRVMRDSADKSYEKSLAVVLDIDETVLDNSPFNVEMMRNGASYSEEIWAEWCEMRAANAIPGALEFTLLAKQLGIDLFYVSNRSEKLLDPTLDNLNDLGFPFADTMHVLLKKESSSKDVRRAAIRENHKILLLIGDNLGDFDGVFDDRSDEYGKGEVRKFRENFGSRFIILPNPMYGSWERGVFQEGRPGKDEVLSKLRGY